MFYTAKVVDNIDKDLTGKIEVYVPVIMTSQTQDKKEFEQNSVKNKFKLVDASQDAGALSKVEVVKSHTIPAYPFSFIEDNRGTLNIPEIGSEVFVTFKDGNWDVCYYMPGNPFKKGKKLNYGEIIEDKENSENPEKYIDHKILLLTKNKHVIALNDTEESNGIIIKAGGVHKIKLNKNDSESSIEIESEKGHKIKIDDENKGIVIQTDRGHSIFLDDSQNGINIKTNSDSRITFDDNKKLIQIVASTGVGLEFDGKNNKLRVDSMDTEVTVMNSVKMDAKKSIEMTSLSDIKMDTTNTSISSKAETKVESTMVKIDAKSNVEISGKANIQIKGEAAVNIESSGNLTVKGSMVTVDAPMINLGNGAISPAVLGDKIMTWLSTHTHTAPMGPTSPPLVPPTPDVLSTSVLLK